MAGRLCDIRFSGAPPWEKLNKAPELTSPQCFVYPLMALIVVSGSQKTCPFSD